jgi:hypothetical protein
MPRASDPGTRSPYRCRHGHARPNPCSRSHLILGMSHLTSSWLRVAAHARSRLGTRKREWGIRSASATWRSRCVNSRGLSQSRLAARAGTSQPAIARLGSGRHVPSVITLLKRIIVWVASGGRPRRSGARGGRPVHARSDAPRDLAAFLGRSSRLLRHPRASALDRRRMSRTTASRSVGESPTASIVAI